MELKLPKDAIYLSHYRGMTLKAFRFNSDVRRAVLPKELIETFPNMGVDMFVSPGEKCLYLTFGPKEKTQFRINKKSGYVVCKKLFEWSANANVPIHNDYRYTNYAVDKKNKIVKLDLTRR